MIINNQRTCVLTVVLFTLALWPGLSQTMDAQELHPSIRQKFGFLPAYRECHPAEVKGFAFGNQALEVLLAQIFVRNRSNKIVTAVKVGWTVYEYIDGVKMAGSACDAVPKSAPGLLSGTTQLIKLGSLGPTETINLGTNPLMIQHPENRTIFVDRPFVTAEDLKSLMLNERRKAEKYMVIIYVSEIHYEDGTTWAAEIN